MQTLLKEIPQDNQCSTWVPDWGNGSTQHVIGHRSTAFHSTGDSKPCLEILTDQKILKIEGLQVDVVESFSRLLYKSDFTFGSLTGAQNEDSIVRDIWNQICEHETFTLDHQYVNGESAVLAFCQTLTAGCLIMALRTVRAAHYYDFPSDTWLKHGAAYLSRVFGNTDLIDDSIREAGIGGDAFGWTGSASTMCRRRCFFRTASGYYGLGPPVEKGDIVCVLFGGTTPYCLRPVGPNYLLVGECYVYGLMNTEAMKMMDRGELKRETFHIL